VGGGGNSVASFLSVDFIFLNKFQQWFQLINNYSRICQLAKPLKSSLSTLPTLPTGRQAAGRRQAGKAVLVGEPGIF